MFDHCKYCEKLNGITEIEIGKPETRKTTWYCDDINEGIVGLFTHEVKRPVNKCKNFKLSLIKLEGILSQ